MSAFGNARGLPLLSCPFHAPIAWRDGWPLDSETFLAHVTAVAKVLPPRTFAANLCADRYLFMVVFAAVGVRGQTSLLPTSRVEGAIQEARYHYPDSYQLSDDAVQAWIEQDAPPVSAPMPHIPAEHVMAIPFTSGSTGSSQPHPKRWGDLVAGAWLAEQRFQFAAAGRPTLVATVPPQHMYGLETTVMLPLVTGLTVHAGHPFFPEDICAALAAVPPPRVLITTPAHLRVCVKANLRWPPLSRIISATAPLSQALAAACEKTFEAMVMEIYGLTEAGSIASRRTVTDELWTTYDGIVIEGGWISAAHLPQPVRAADVFDARSPTQFALTGRQQDLVNIGGKRTSLAYLNQVLVEIEGVDDGIFVLPQAEKERPQRLLALVVAPRSGKQRILAALAERIDPIFLPRPLLMVDALPRNDMGKLPQEALRELVGSLQADRRVTDAS
ncbi:MAG: AMP-binding protein [Hyphomicrobium sp.]